MMLAVGNVLAVALYLIGFAETLVENLRDDANFSITGNAINDTRIWANILLIFVLFLALIGLKYVIKAQLGLLAFICFAIFCLILGSFYQTEENKLFGYKGWYTGNFEDNLYPQYTQNYDFWTVLAIYFPAVTGIMAGANISGDLRYELLQQSHVHLITQNKLQQVTQHGFVCRNPSTDIPKGTISAIIVSSSVYMILAMIVGAVAARTELIENALVMADICAATEYIVLLGIYAATL